MNRVKLSIFTVIFIATVFTFFSSCEGVGGKSALAGRWDLVEGSAEDDPEDMELLNDGTGIIDKEGITYKTESGRFYVMSQSGEAESYGYKVSGSELTLTKDNGTVLKYIDLKKQKPPSFTNFTDSRNGKVYKTVKMPNGKVWFAENLNYAAEGSKCYENKEENCQKYGRLYDWATAMKSCPKGWHLPSEKEWEDLPKAKHLKAKEGWEENGNGTDAFGFAALPGGNGSSIAKRCVKKSAAGPREKSRRRSKSYSDDSFNNVGCRSDYSDGSFSNVGYRSDWWTASENSSYGIYYRDGDYVEFEFVNIDDDDEYDYDNKRYLYNVRCIQD
jgi:uncharacterized protein (TIGR02145 family)